MFDDIASVTLQTALAAISQSQRVSANNIANIDTPGYQATRVSFADSLASAVSAGDPASATVSVSPTGDPPGVNGNNVNLDTEMVDDTKSQMQYQLVSTAMNAKFDLLSTVIKG